MSKTDITLEKDPYFKELTIGFEDPCIIKKKYGDLWDKEEIKREKRLLNIQSNFIYHPLPSNDDQNEIEFYAPFFLTLHRLLDNDFQTNHELFQKYQYSWILQGAKAISDIHSNKLYHGRLSDESFYVDEKLIIRIGNIGYGTKEYSTKTHQYYMPPEGFALDFNINELQLFNQQKYDVYSFGIIMLNILTLQCYENSLYDKPDIRLEKKDYKPFKKIVDSQLKEFNSIEPEFSKIIRLCLDKDPNKRIKSDLLFKEIRKIIEVDKKDHYAIDSLSVVSQPLNAFEAMKIIPQNFPIKIQIIKELYESCTYEDVLQVILSHPKLIEILNSSIPGPLITYTLNKTQFEINYENSHFITASKDQYFKDHSLCWLFSVTLHELLYDYNFIPNNSDLLFWFLNIQYYILSFIVNKVPVCNISLNSIFVTFGVDKAQLFLFPISEERQDEKLNLINWVIQFGIIMEEIYQYYKSKTSELNQNTQNSQEIVDIEEIDDFNDISHIQSFIKACSSLKEKLKNGDSGNSEDYNQMVNKIFSFLLSNYEKSKEMIEVNIDQERSNIFNIFLRLNHFLSLPSKDRYKDCTRNDIELMQSLIYATINCIVPDDYQISNMDEAINPLNILHLFYDILHHNELKPLASKEISKIDESIRKMKIENPIVHEFDLTGLQVYLFRQFMISTVPKVFSNDNNHKLIITVNNDNSNRDLNEDQDDDSNIFITLQNVIDFAEESNIEYELIDDHTVSLHYYTY